ncbi:MAG: C69 family dipeptidase [Bacteroidales bacterium]
MNSKLKLWFVFTWLLAGLSVQAQSEFNCFTVVAGKKATVDGSVMLAHNEDDYAEGMDIYFNIYQVPASEIVKQVSQKSKKEEKSGKTLSEGNVAYLWLEMPGMPFSDSYMNEHGVVIVSDACPSREDKPQLTGAGITWELRNAMARQATSARHAVEIAQKLILEKGYNSSGRTYIIADPNEAWMLSVVYGKHFVALRIPDDAIAVIPNYYTITTFDTADHQNVITSPGLIEYAIQRGWYNPADGPFNFRKAYASKESLEHMVNVGRMWAGVNLMADRKFELKEDFPWILTPREPVTLEKMMQVLSNHYEGSELEAELSEKISNPHDADPGSICAKYTRYGMVAHLQSGLPRELANVLWLSPMRPCSHAFVPLMVGMKEMPQGMASQDYTFALQNHLKPAKNPREDFPKLDYWKFERDAHLIDVNYKNLGRETWKNAQEMSRLNIQMFYELQRNSLVQYKADADSALNNLWKFCVDAWKRLTEDLEKREGLPEVQESIVPLAPTIQDPRQITLPNK